ncbi:MAG TPA: alpha-D-ribose 1-methylphosphonate 5-triphosphate diphosphatase [Bryobacteraceae bacterium]|nr:alpha-D-ribose 1-methylphosphonate 5-triphosphate diphosphatase [Bryobacteraceae bacterium]
MNRSILSNALVVLPGRTVEGSVVVEGERIAEVVPNRRFAEGYDLGGQFLAPGIIDIHTDYLEKEIRPRPSAEIPLGMAFHTMDLRAIACGLTTVLGAARISGDHDGRTTGWRGDGLKLARAYQTLRRTALARHLIHVRWNPNFAPVEQILAEVLQLDSIGNIVYNDSLPGERQFRDVEEQIRKLAARQGISEEEARERFEARRQAALNVNNRMQVKAAVEGKIPLGSHDDTTVEHVLEAHASGATLSEMPCSIEAARKAKELGMMVCMGAPNYFRGGSHCGNLSCPDAMAEGLVDILCSDFHFPSLLGSAVKMMRAGMTPSDALNMMSLNPARYLRLERDLGSIEEGKKADLIAFSAREDFAVVTGVWVEGQERMRTGMVLQQRDEAAVA